MIPIILIKIISLLYKKAIIIIINNKVIMQTIKKILKILNLKALQNLIIQFLKIKNRYPKLNLNHIYLMMIISIHKIEKTKVIHFHLVK